jgi:hypothetical protein
MMMRYLCLAAVMTVAISSCAGGEKTADTTAAATAGGATADRPTTAAKLANAIAANPAAADSILTAAGYTRDSFQQLMYDIAADSAMSATYAAAKSR